MQEKIPDLNLFMMAKALRPEALRALPPGYHFRTLRREELALWKAFPFDDPKTAREYEGYMTDFFGSVYAKKSDLFFEKCIVVCDESDMPIGTCFAWKAYEAITTIHWYKVRKGYEGRGIGRALLSYVMQGIAADEYPVFLHTQPESFRAIKLYLDFGFSMLTDEVIGSRENHLQQCMPILKKHMKKDAFASITVAKAPDDFLRAVSSSPINQF